jgi:hypothetical protein
MQVAEALNGKPQLAERLLHRLKVGSKLSW